MSYTQIAIISVIAAIVLDLLIIKSKLIVGLKKEPSKLTLPILKLTAFEKIYF